MQPRLGLDEILIGRVSGGRRLVLGVVGNYGVLLPGAFDVRNIATHEIGHFCGLADLYKGGSRELTMYGYGASKSSIREIAAYGAARKAEIGAENVFDFSLGNPSVPAPAEVAASLKASAELPPAQVHGTP